MPAVKIIDKNPLLNQDVIKQFVESVTKTISLMSNTTVVAHEPKFINQFKFESEIAGIVGISTDNEKGILVLSFEKKSILKIHNNMLGENEVELTDIVIDLVGELTNMVYGFAKTSLNHLGYQFQMSIPTITQGAFRLTKKSVSPTVIIPFVIDGKFKFSIALSVE